MPSFAHFDTISSTSTKPEIRKAEALLWGVAYATDGYDDHIDVAVQAGLAKVR